MEVLERKRRSIVEPLVRKCALTPHFDIRLLLNIVLLAQSELQVFFLGGKHLNIPEKHKKNLVFGFLTASQSNSPMAHHLLVEIERIVVVLLGGTFDKRLSAWSTIARRSNQVNAIFTIGDIDVFKEIGDIFGIAIPR
jgi:hypothetical protein